MSDHDHDTRRRPTDPVMAARMAFWRGTLLAVPGVSCLRNTQFLGRCDVVRVLQLRTSLTTVASSETVTLPTAAVAVAPVSPDPVALGSTGALIPPRPAPTALVGIPPIRRIVREKTQAPMPLDTALAVLRAFALRDQSLNLVIQVNMTDKAVSSTNAVGIVQS